MSLRAYARKGDTCSFTARIKSGIAARYTQARFQVRESFDESGPLLLEAETGDGITIDHGTGVVAVSIGATKTELLPVTVSKRSVAAQLRFYDPTNPEDRFSFPIPFDLLPEAIDD